MGYWDISSKTSKWYWVEVMPLCVIEFDEKCSVWYKAQSFSLLQIQFLILTHKMRQNVIQILLIKQVKGFNRMK